MSKPEIVVNDLLQKDNKTGENKEQETQKSNNLSTKIFEEALAYHNKGDLKTAFALYKTDIAMNKRNMSSYVNIAMIMEKGMDHENALKCYEHVLNIYPMHFNALNNVAGLYRILGEYEKSFECAYKCHFFYPDNIEGIMNLGVAYRYLGRNDMAQRMYEKSLKLRPEYTHALFNISYAKLGMGKMNKDAWGGYEKRIDVYGVEQQRGDYITHINKWQGENLDNKTLFIHYEQGYGDTIQFIRILPLLKQRYKNLKVIYCAPQALFKLLQSYKYIDELYDFPYIRKLVTDEELEKFPQADYRISLMSLPYYMDYQSHDIDNSPYLEPTGKPSFIIDRKKDNKKHIAIVWRVNVAAVGNKHRNMLMDDALKIIEALHEDVHFYSLQKGKERADILHSPYKIMDMAPWIEDFNDTANLMKQMDCVISVDTSVVHLAGAIGVPCHLLLPLGPDWRWGEKAGLYDWYQNMHIYRQKKLCMWDEVIEQVINNIRNS